MNPVPFPQNPRFRLNRVVGQGGMGVVFVAEDSESADLVAVKCLHAAGPEATERLKREFRALAGVRHPNLVSLYELFADDDDLFFTMEYVDGVDFLAWTRLSAAAGPETWSLDDVDEVRPATGDVAPEASAGFDEARLRDGLAQLAVGVDAIHRQGLVHNDVKPRNVLVSRGRVVLLDFGITRVFGVGAARLEGTIDYMAPELLEGRPPQAASDWYAVGVVLYEALTGRRPFSGPVAGQLADKLGHAFEHPQILAAGVPDDLARLVVELLRPEPERRAGYEEIVSALDFGRPRPRKVVDFGEGVVGRDAELARLEAVLTRARGGRRQALYLHGPSGVGKSALLRAFLRRVETVPQVLLLSGRCYERETVRFKAFDDVAEGLVRHLRGLPSAELRQVLPVEVDALVRVFPSFHHVAGGGPVSATVTDPQEARRRGIVALRHLLEALARTHLVLLAIDDLQWADTESAVVVEELLRVPADTPLLLVGAFRDESVEAGEFARHFLKARDMGPRRGDVVRVAVRPLDRAATAGLARECLEAVGADPGAAEVVARESGGHPYLVQELARFAASGRTAGGLTLDEMLGRRVEALDPEARDLLEVVVVADGRLPTAAACRAVGLGVRRYEVVDRLCDAHLLRTVGSGRFGALETFHDRVRETVAAGLGADPRRRWHQYIAHALEATGYRDDEQLAVHYFHAGDRVRAGRHARRAAAAADASLAFDRAAALYHLAVDLAEPGEVRDLRLRLGEALANAGRGPAAAEALVAVAGTMSGVEALQLRRRAGEQLLVCGHVEEGLGLLREVLDAVGLRVAETPRRALVSLLWHRLRLWFRGLEPQKNPAPLSPEDGLRIDAAWAIALGLGSVDVIRGAEFGARHLLYALETGDPYRLARAFALETGFRGTPGVRNEPEVREVAARALAQAERVDDPHARAHALALATVTRGLAEHLFGNWKASNEALDEAERRLLSDTRGATWELATAQRYNVSNLWFLGRLKLLHERLPQVMRAAEDRANRYAAVGMGIRFGHMVRLIDDRPELARSELERHQAAWTGSAFHLQHYGALFSAVQTALYEGDVARAQARLAQDEPRLRASLLTRNNVLWIEYQHFVGRVALASGDLRRARAAIARLERERLSPWAAAYRWTLEAGIDPAHLPRARIALEKVHMALYAAAVREREEPGNDVTARYMEEQGVRNPARMVEMLVPTARAHG